MTTTIPVGALVMFGGAIEGLRISQLREEGWLLCDGASYQVDPELQALFDRIRTNYGGDSSSFNVPDFRGRFSRGTDHGRGKDPDAGSRVALNAGGNTGDKVGSAQPYATGRPVDQFQTAEAGPHQHVAPHASTDYHNTPLSAWGTTCMEWPGEDKQTGEAGDHAHTVSGGDSESRPSNVYAHYLLKFKNIETLEPDEAAAEADETPLAVVTDVPIGAVLLFAGDASDGTLADKLRAEGWLPCFGQSLATTDAAYKALFNVVQYVFGGSGETFKLPDLRGQFIRGARTSIDTGPGATLGTDQGYNTMLPLHHAETKGDSLLEVAAVGGHTHTLDNLPKNRHWSYYTAGHQTAEFGGDNTLVDSAGAHWHAIVGGGDKETRPINVYVDFIIKFAEPTT